MVQGRDPPSQSPATTSKHTHHHRYMASWHGAAAICFSQVVLSKHTQCTQTVVNCFNKQALPPLASAHHYYYYLRHRHAHTESKRERTVIHKPMPHSLAHWPSHATTKLVSPPRCTSHCLTATRFYYCASRHAQQSICPTATNYS